MQAKLFLQWSFLQSPVLDNVFYVALPDAQDALAVELLHFQQLQNAEHESQKLSESKTSPTESSAEDIEQFPGSTSCLNRIFCGRHRFDAVEDKAQTWKAKQQVWRRWLSWIYKQNLLRKTELELLLKNVSFQCHYNHDNKQIKKCLIVFLCHWSVQCFLTGIKFAKLPLQINNGLSIGADGPMLPGEPHVGGVQHCYGCHQHLLFFGCGELSHIVL